jgi:hypothetical protein
VLLAPNPDLLEYPNDFCCVPPCCELFRELGLLPGLAPAPPRELPAVGGKLPPEDLNRLNLGSMLGETVSLLSSTPELSELAPPALNVPV